MKDEGGGVANAGIFIPNGIIGMFAALDAT
jgi:hypothetical protein